MKRKILCGLAAVALLAGCAEVRKNMGAANENDQNVLTGGPVSGTRLKDLPEPVRDTLKQKVPTAEVADIDKQTQNGKVVYKVSFSEPGKNPTLYVSQDGQVVQTPK
jgi:uncharacterized membrane protein YkoI